MRMRHEVERQELTRRQEVLFWLALFAWMAGMFALSMAVTVVVELVDRPAAGPVSVTVAAAVWW
jgi:hypothetical protein